MPHIRDLIEMREHGFPICSLSVRGRRPFSNKPTFFDLFSKKSTFLYLFFRASCPPTVSVNKMNENLKKLRRQILKHFEKMINEKAPDMSKMFDMTKISDQRKYLTRVIKMDAHSLKGTDHHENGINQNFFEKF